MAFLQSFTVTNFRVSRRSTISLTQEDLMVDNVPCFQLFLVWFPHDGELKLARRAHSGACHVQLAMPEHLSPQPHPNVLQSLALRLIDGDGKRRSDRELPALPLEGILSRLGNESNSGYQYHPIRAHYPAFQQLVIDCTLEH